MACHRSPRGVCGAETIMSHHSLTQRLALHRGNLSRFTQGTSRTLEFQGNRVLFAKRNRSRDRLHFQPSDAVGRGRRGFAMRPDERQRQQPSWFLCSARKHCRASQSLRPDLQNQSFHSETDYPVNGYHENGERGEWKSRPRQNPFQTGGLVLVSDS